MREILFEYELNPTTWVYVSSLMILGIFFKFHRLWSVRNLDLIGLIAFSPGLLLVSHGLQKISDGEAIITQEASARGQELILVGEELERYGYVWLFAIGGFFLIRLLFDAVMVRRPLLEPNLSASGLTFTCAALLVFLMTNIATTKMTESDLAGVQRLEQILARQESPPGKTDLAQHGPGYPLFYSIANFTNRAFVRADSAGSEEMRRARLEDATARTTAILAHLALVLGVVLIGYRHFDSIQTGVAVATLYLLLPYTAQMTGRVDHVVPAALLVWAVAAYRRPMIAGILLGLAAGVIYYPLFLLPLWCGFYWRRGLMRFLFGVVLILLLLVASLALTSNSWELFAAQLQQMSGWTSFIGGTLSGFWHHFVPAYRMPVMIAFLALCAGMAIWPPQKNLGTLLSCSAAVMLGTQFWNPYNGGIYMAWYMPLLVLTIFRPNLEDRVAQSAVFELWIRWRRKRPEKAATQTAMS
jgi:hypothetical protein